MVKRLKPWLWLMVNGEALLIVDGEALVMVNGEAAEALVMVDG